MEVERAQCLRIYAPEWYLRPDFRAFLELQTGHPSRPLATWHSGGEPHDMSDVFMTFNGGDLSEADLLPLEIVDQLLHMIENAGMTFGMIWLSNATKELEHESSR